MMRKIERESSGCLKVGQDLVVTGYAGLAGSIAIVKRKRAELSPWFSKDYLDGIIKLEELLLPEGLDFIGDYDAAECEPSGEGGILKSLWDLSGGYEMGMEFFLRRIPIRQETIEVCERCEINPYRLYSKGCYLLAGENGAQLAERLQAGGFPAAVIGKMNWGIAREMVIQSGRGYLERPVRDELYKIIK